MFTHEELIAILRICDAGCRAGGLDTAEMAIPIAHKVRRLIQGMNTQRNNEVPTMLHSVGSGNGNMTQPNT